MRATDPVAGQSAIYFGFEGEIKTMRMLAATAAVACAFACTTASADIIIGNLGDISGGGTLFGSAATTQHKAAGFTMGSDAYFLDSVTLTVANATAGSTAHVMIWEGTGSPQNMIADLTDFSFTGHSGAMDFTWTPSTQIVLDANTTYWVYLENIFNQGDSWLWESGSTTPTGVATSAGYWFNGGPSSFMNTYQVDGTLVPAPAGGVALLLGAAGLSRRRRRRA